MFVVGECCWYNHLLKIVKVGGGDELTISSQHITDTALGLLARVENGEEKTTLIFNTYGYVLLQDYHHRSKVAVKLYNARTIPYGITGSMTPRVAEVRRYSKLEAILKVRRELPLLPITGRLILAFKNEIPIGDFGTQKFARNCWIVTEEQKRAFFSQLN